MTRCAPSPRPLRATEVGDRPRHLRGLDEAPERRPLRRHAAARRIGQHRRLGRRRGDDVDGDAAGIASAAHERLGRRVPPSRPRRHSARPPRRRCGCRSGRPGRPLPCAGPGGRPAASPPRHGAATSWRRPRDAVRRGGRPAGGRRHGRGRRPATRRSRARWRRGRRGRGRGGGSADARAAPRPGSRRSPASHRRGAARRSRHRSRTRPRDEGVAHRLTHRPTPRLRSPART